MSEQKEKEQLRKRMQELAQRSFQNNHYTFTPFLSLSEQQDFYEIKRELDYAGCTLEGGTPLSERKMIRFGSEERLGYVEQFPISCIRITPTSMKFAQTLSHRDFLGALMNLGVERSRIGDIFVEEKQAVVFCLDNIADFIMENLTRVRHTNVECTKIEVPMNIKEPASEEVYVSVASVRIDGVLSKLYNISRTSSIELFRSGRVFVNGRIMENNSYHLKENDAVTARGFGKFIYEECVGETKKGKDRICVRVFR